MLPVSDYHMHTPLCGHAEGEPHEYAAHAVKMKLREIGFSDHAPLVSHRDPSLTMDFKDLPRYHSMMEKLRDDFKGKLIVKIGIEADFVPGYEEKTKTLLIGYPYDFVIGSVHFIKNWGFDNPAEKGQWDKVNVDTVYRQYYEHLQKSALSGLYDIMGHVDLVKKFGHRPTEKMTDYIKETAEVFKETGMVVEVNTSGLRKPVKEIYPALDALKIYCQAGVPITFGSDSHLPQDVGKDYDKAVSHAKAAGYKEYVIFKDRNISEVIAL